MTSSNHLSFEEKRRRIAAEAALRFPPPYVEHALDGQGFYFHWQKLQLVFSLPNPADFPPLSVTLDARDRAAVVRYVQACRELASYSLLSYTGGYTVHSDASGDRVEVDNPPKEALRGFMVLFRQIHSDGDEPASFKVVRSILSKTSAQLDDGQKEARLGIATQWHRARAALLQRSLSERGQSKIFEGLGGSAEALSLRSRHTPPELFSLFNYGEYIHWGEKREEHAALFRDEIGAAIAEFNFLDAMIGLAHFYFGYAKLLETAFDDISNSSHPG